MLAITKKYEILEGESVSKIVELLEGYTRGDLDPMELKKRGFKLTNHRGEPVDLGAYADLRNVLKAGLRGAIH
ncbi:hypothetical protein [Helicobacter felistomachi]|uniref:hypothetical protein n=1 Tax=Helicobacter felistomachi TaxID=3040201 RepID=UPI002573E1B0|nr:hypothetical protein [Helicobacter sp. NHP21005]